MEVVCGHGLRGLHRNKITVPKQGTIPGEQRLRDRSLGCRGMRGEALWLREKSSCGERKQAAPLRSHAAGAIFLVLRVFGLLSRREADLKPLSANGKRPVIPLFYRRPSGVPITELCAANPPERGHAPDLQNESAIPGALPAERSTHGHRMPDTGMIPSASIRRPD